MRAELTAEGDTTRAVAVLNSEWGLRVAGAKLGIVLIPGKPSRTLSTTRMLFAGS